MVEADHAVHLGAGEIQCARNRRDGFGRDVAETLMDRVQHRNQRAGFVGQAGGNFVELHVRRRRRRHFWNSSRPLSIAIPRLVLVILIPAVACCNLTIALRVGGSNDPQIQI